MRFHTVVQVGMVHGYCWRSVVGCSPMKPKSRLVGQWYWEAPVAEIGPLGRLGY